MPDTEITSDLELLLEVVPTAIREALENETNLDDLIEVIMDLGRRPEARFPGRSVFLADDAMDRAGLDHVVDRVGAFTGDNRAGIERTLHRISAMRNRRGLIIGLTCRVGRAVLGTVDILRNVIESGKSLLLLGPPGIGKTTLLRESARVLSTELAEAKRVIVVDTSNEIGGDGDISHPGIGKARRMQVPAPELQHAVMVEAVENHMPEVIVIDEIGTEAEALAARTIAERGVQLIATAHGSSLDNLLMNPTLSDLLGGIQAVTLGDDEARRRRTQKTVLERKAPPTFETLVEIHTRDRFSVYLDTASVVDAFLRGRTVQPEIRVRDSEGYRVEREEVPVAAEEPPPIRRRGRRSLGNGGPGRSKALRIFPYGISRDRLQRAIDELKVPATISKTPHDANLVLTLKAHEKRQPRALLELEERGLQPAVLRSNTLTQMKGYLTAAFGLEKHGDVEEEALRETREGVDRVLSYGKPVELSPQPSQVRRLQHLLVAELGLGSRSKGETPWRRVTVLPTRG